MIRLTSYDTSLITNISLVPVVKIFILFYSYSFSDFIQNIVYFFIDLIFSHSFMIYDEINVNVLNFYH